MSLQIRQAGRDDVALISGLAHEIWPATYSRLMTREKLDYMLELIYSRHSLLQQIDKGHEFIIISNDGNDVGFASTGQLENGIFKLHKIYVLPGEQGKGTGRFMIDHIINDITIRGGTALRLNVKRDNPARHFYEKMGFVVIGEEDIDIGGGHFMEDFVMEKSL